MQLNHITLIALLLLNLNATGSENAFPQQLFSGVPVHYPTLAYLFKDSSHHAFLPLGINPGNPVGILTPEQQLLENFRKRQPGKTGFHTPFRKFELNSECTFNESFHFSEDSSDVYELHLQKLEDSYERTQPNHIHASMHEELHSSGMPSPRLRAHQEVINDLHDSNEERVAPHIAEPVQIVVIIEAPLPGHSKHTEPVQGTEDSSEPDSDSDQEMEDLSIPEECHTFDSGTRAAITEADEYYTQKYPEAQVIPPFNIIDNYLQEVRHRSVPQTVNTVEQVVGSEGGVLITSSKMAQLIIPEGALDKKVLIVLIEHIPVSQQNSENIKITVNTAIYPDKYKLQHEGTLKLETSFLSSNPEALVEVKVKVDHGSIPNQHIFLPCKGDNDEGTLTMKIKKL